MLYEEWVYSNILIHGLSDNIIASTYLNKYRKGELKIIDDLLILKG